MAAPVAGELWAGGRRRRRTARLVPALAAACVAALVTVALWPARRAAGLGARRHRSTATVRPAHVLPVAIPKPPFLAGTARPGVTAAVLARARATPSSCSPCPRPGRRDPHLVLPDVPSSTRPWPCLPDGRWLAAGLRADATSLGGATVPSAGGAGRARLDADARAGSAWWSPDSRRVLRRRLQPGHADLRRASSSAPTERSPRRPSSPAGPVPLVAGWLDSGHRARVRRAGDGAASPARVAPGGWVTPSWEVSTLDLQWSSDGTLDGSEVSSVRADLSPDGTRLLADQAASPTRRSDVLELDPGDDVRRAHRRPLGMPDARGPPRAGARGRRAATSSGAAGAAVRPGATASRSAPTTARSAAVGVVLGRRPRRRLLALRVALRRLRRERPAGHPGGGHHGRLAGAPVGLGWPAAASSSALVGLVWLVHPAPRTGVPACGDADAPSSPSCRRAADRGDPQHVGHGIHPWEGRRTSSWVT